MWRSGERLDLAVIAATYELHELRVNHLTKPSFYNLIYKNESNNIYFTRALY